MRTCPGTPGRAWRPALRSVLTLACLACLAGAAAAADISPGRTKAQACAVCHGLLGISVSPDTPNIAGQPAIYLSAQLKAYRNGERKHEVMSLMAKPLSDEDIALLAAWFASIRIEAQPPP